MYRPFLGALLPVFLGGALAATACGSSSDQNVLGTTSPDGGSSGEPGSSSSGGTASSSSGSSGSDGSAPSGAIKTVFVIMMENHSWSTIASAGSAATYINGTLVPMGAHAEQYFTPPGNHPSEPNYIWLEAGDNLGIKNDDAPSKNHQSTTDHLVSQLEAKSISWKAYAEGISGDGCPLSAISSAEFDPKHTPQLYFDDVTGTNNQASTHCHDHVRPYSELADDITKNQVARYNFITPNLCNDMHGALKCLSGLIQRGDDWLKSEVPKILASDAYKDNGVIFIVWDEGDEPLVGSASDGPIGLIALSPKAKPGFASQTAYTHSSLFRTLQTIFGVPYLRGATTASDVSDLFTSFP